MGNATTPETIDQSPAQGALTVEDQNRLRRIAYAKLADGKIEDFEQLAEVMRVFQPGDPVFTLLRLVNLARAGQTATAEKLLNTVSVAYQGAAARLELDAQARRDIEGAIEAVRSWLPGGKRNTDTRRELQDAATMFLPRLKPSNGVA